MIGQTGDGANWIWNPFPASKPPDGVKLVLRLAINNKADFYALGTYDQRTGNFQITAKERQADGSVAYWLALPKS